LTAGVVLLTNVSALGVAWATAETAMSNETFNNTTERLQR
jgi:hypothetical protein